MIPSKIKLCFLIPSLQAGGIETYLVRFLRRYGKEIAAVVIVIGAGKGELYNEYIKTGAIVRPTTIGYFNVYAWFKLYKFFKSEKFNAVCDMRANFAGIPLTVARMANVKKRIAFFRQSSHHFTPTYFKLAYANLVNWLVYKNATTILANSQYALIFYFGNKIDTRCKVIKNGVNSELFEMKERKEELRKYFGLPANKIIVGHTGRVTAAKNHATIIEVARMVCRNNKNVVFVLAGNGTKDLPQQEGMITLGYCSEIPKLLKTFDLYYFPSLTEGQPNSLIEAMISGLPFVASDIIPIRECVPESNFSQLVSATDIQRSTAKIEEVINSDAKNNYCCKVWAKEVFDANRNFSLFYTELR